MGAVRLNARTSAWTPDQFTEMAGWMASTAADITRAADAISTMKPGADR
ncbi:hypothetical protein [Streptomyces sp. 2231.1]|nr:hypothetical protein [Streptomyces sp. 2231.1]